MIKSPAPIKPPKIARTSSKNWLHGTVTAFDDGRTPMDGLRASGNVILDQDGTIRPRPSMTLYGTQPLGTILGEVYEFVQAAAVTNVNWLITMQNVAGVANVYVNKDGGAWTIATGKTYNLTAAAHFVQIDNKVLIMNGTDNLSYLDIPTMAVIPFTALLAAPAPTLTTNTGLTGTTFNYYYQISANSTVGETAASAKLTVPVSTQREQWVGATQNITIGWAAVTGATSYNVYLATSSTATAFFLATVSKDSLSYKDLGSVARNVNIPATLSDTTPGPRVTRGTVINGQVFLVGDADNSRYVRFGGTGTAILDFSPFGGGGWVEIGRGTKEFPVRVMSFRDGRGNSQITVLCHGTNGTGKRYIMSPTTVTVGATIINYLNVIEDNGQDGTDSPDGVVLYRDSLWYPSRDGFKTTGTKPQLQNILSTDTVSETITNDIHNLNNANMVGCVGLAFQGRIYWAVPNGTTTNNEIWVLDLNRGGAWMKPWNISASWMNLYNSNDGNTHQLILSANGLYELTYALATNDSGVSFATNITSGLIKFSEDTLEWAKVIDVTFVLLRPQGLINLTVSGKTEDSSLVTVGSNSFAAAASLTVAGWGEAGWGGSPDLAIPQIFGWSNFGVVPVAFGIAQSLVTVEVDEELEWLQWELNSPASGVDYQLADVVLRYVPIGVKSLDS